MTNKITETRRALFEKKIALPETVKWSYEQGCYVGANFWLVQFGWDAFNAALDSMEIELPLCAHNAWHDYDLGYNAALSDVLAAIESTNLGLKVK